LKSYYEGENPMKKTILMLTVVLLLVAVPAMAKKDKGDVPQILWAATAVDIIPAVDDIPEMVQFDWLEETEAEKYSLDIEGEGTVDVWNDNGTPDAEGDDYLDLGVEVEFSVSYSAVDHVLIMPVQDVLDDLIAAILAELGVEIDDVEDGELLALDVKVKGLDPHSEDVDDVKSQDNMFSEKISLMPLFD
jgi:hypothetical protein